MKKLPSTQQFSREVTNYSQVMDRYDEAIEELGEQIDALRDKKNGEKLPDIGLQVGDEVLFYTQINPSHRYRWEPVVVYTLNGDVYYQETHYRGTLYIPSMDQYEFITIDPYEWLCQKSKFLKLS